MANIRENRAIRLYKRECYSGESSPENIRYLPLAQSLSAKGCISLSLSLSLSRSLTRFFLCNPLYRAQLIELRSLQKCRVDLA